MLNSHRFILVFGSILSMMFILTGCIDTPDASGWRPSQKKALLQIAHDDPYLSLCDAKKVYERIVQGKSSRADDWDALLVRYAENLANSCIDLKAFQKAQKSRVNDDFKSHYEIYYQNINPSALAAQVRSGKSIASILEPYIPKQREFTRLINAYNAQKKLGASASLLHKIRLNIERVKLMKPLQSNRYILINIPEYTLRLIEKNRTVLSMRTVVGKPKMQTPIFAQQLAYIVLNPPWNVPESIVRKELLPKIIKNPAYLRKKGMEVHRTYDLNSPVVDLKRYNLVRFLVDKNATEYEKQHPKPMPFHIIQLPSKKNGLGRVKFLFPNRFSVYMHDTQSKYLFKRSYRAYSHGCVRLSKPNVLLRYLVEHYTDTSWEEAIRLYNDMETHFIRITKPLPVYLSYFTVYVDDDGRLHQLKDIYGYDTIQHLRF